VYVALLLSAVIGPIHRAFATEVMRMLIPDWHESTATTAGGPLIGIIFLLLFPFIFGIPIAYITAELSTAYPQDGEASYLVSLSPQHVLKHPTWSLTPCQW